jgi:hypothetical protein
MARRRTASSRDASRSRRASKPARQKTRTPLSGSHRSHLAVLRHVRPFPVAIPREPRSPITPGTCAVSLRATGDVALSIGGAASCVMSVTPTASAVRYKSQSGVSRRTTSSPGIPNGVEMAPRLEGKSRCSGGMTLHEARAHRGTPRGRRRASPPRSPDLCCGQLIMHSWL